tara:strand:- start:204 stop:401 length:198 start_codon:yes stop_codon:yes gene_type:complete
MKYKCKCKTFEVTKNTIKIVDGEVVAVEAYCKDCNTYGKFIKEDKGFGSIFKRPNGTVSNRKDFI